MQGWTSERKFETRDAIPAPARPDPIPPKIPGPIPWIPTEAVSSVSVSCFWCERPHPGEHPLSVCSPCAARHSAVRSLEMSGSYPLVDSAIDEELTQTSPGNYALGYMDGDEFTVFYVGRSDSDVKQRLHDWVRMPSRYESHASSAKASWAVNHRGQLPVDVPALGPVGSSESSYTRFAYSYARTAEEAYAKEWRNYDAFGGRHGLDNETQPVSADCRRSAR